MQLSEEARAIRDLVDDFGKRELMDAYRDLEPEGEFPYELVAKLSEMGLMGISFPEEYGGMGMDTIVTSVVGERLAFYWPSLQLIWSANVSLVGFPIMTFGTEEQKQRFLPRLASGEIFGCYALTESDAGSDAAGIKTLGLRVGPQGVLGEPHFIHGAKLYITSADVASVGVVFAKRPPGGGKEHERISAFILESSEPGFKDIAGVQVTDIPKWGFTCCHFSEILLDKVDIPEEMVLGGRDGWRVAMETLNNGRINIAAQAVGIARRAFHEFLEYAKTRKTFGKPLIENQAIAFPLADFETRIEAAWLLTLEASHAKDAGEDYARKASMAKLFASQTAKGVASFCSEHMGGIGYTLEHIAERIHQDARATEIYEGASNIQRMIISKAYRE